MFENLEIYGRIIQFYIPLGIIGVWRWSVWMIKKIISFFYRNPGGTYSATLSVVTPVYNEDPDNFRMALESWKNNGPDEIIAVIDYTDRSSIDVFKKFQKGFMGAKLIITEKPGKRSALADGIRIANGEIVALADSDTFWSPGIKQKILGPFSDPKVGGLVTRQDVLETDTLSRRIFKILLDDRYLFEYPFLGAVSDALLCLSGRTAVYRKAAIEDKLDELINETFWGRSMISGDDKTLTHLVQKEGWKTRYVRDAVVYTSGITTVSGFLKQKLRWARNGLRSDSKALASGWLWKNHKILALYMLDKFISPIVLLLAPAFFVIALLLGHWQFALLILLWWITSRAVKIYPHLKEKPEDIVLLPVYILMTFVMAIVKIYALTTIDEQNWITRWHKIRMAPLGFFRRVFSYMATASVLSLVFFALFAYQDYTLGSLNQERQRSLDAQKFSIFTPDMPRPSTVEIEQVKTDLIRHNQGDAYGYYTVLRKDTLSGLRKKFNIPDNSEVLDAQTKQPIPRNAYLVVGQRLAFNVEDLRNPLSKDVIPQYPYRLYGARYDPAVNTIFVDQPGSVITLSSISRALGPSNRNLLEETGNGEWILRANLYIKKNATFVLDGEEVKYLKLKSDEKTVWIRIESSNALISNTKITSWDENLGRPDENHENDRAYVTVTKNGRMDVLNSEIAYLGSAGFPRRGGAFGGSYGISWKNKGGGYPEVLLTGVVAGNKLHHNYFGFYTYGVSGMLVENNEVYENVEYGIDPHDDSNNMLISKNVVRNNGNHGIITSKRCFNNIIADNASFDNRLHGIMLDRQSNNNLVKGNTIYGNTDGIAIYDSDQNVILENEIRNNHRGVRVNEGSVDNYFEGNEVIDNARGFYIYGQAQSNMAVSNSVKNNDVGITLKNTSNNLLLDNYSIFDNEKDGRVTEGSYGNNIQ